MVSFLQAILDRRLRIARYVLDLLANMEQQDRDGGTERRSCPPCSRPTKLQRKDSKN
jgi:hypothetical protein